MRQCDGPPAAPPALAGLVNAFPRESGALVEAARAGKHAKARALYDWFLPLLRLDPVPKFVR